MALYTCTDVTADYRPASPNINIYAVEPHVTGNDELGNTFEVSTISLLRTDIGKIAYPADPDTGGITGSHPVALTEETDMPVASILEHYATKWVPSSVTVELGDDLVQQITRQAGDSERGALNGDPADSIVVSLARLIDEAQSTE